MKKSNLDEMQEQTLLHIEHNCCWLAIWSLAASITVQGILGCYLDHILGEVICLFLVCTYMAISCLKQGIWDRKILPCRKNNLLCSLTASAFIGIFSYFLLSGKPIPRERVTSITLALMAFVFLLSMAVLSILTVIYKKRSEVLEKE